MSSLVTLDNGKLVAIGPISTPVALDVGITDNVHGKKSTYAAFGSLKTVSETIIGDYRFDLLTFESSHDVVVTGFGRYAIEAGGTGARIVTGALASSSCTITSKETHYYQAGRGLMIKQSIITGDSGTAGNVREWGLINTAKTNGTFLRLNGTTLQWVILNNGVETVINSSAWDVPVTHNGFGHIWYIQMEWLGVGDIYLYRDEVLVHTLNHVGTSTEFSIGTPDLKLYYYIANTSNATDLYMKFGSASVISEGNSSSIRLNQQPIAHALGLLTKGVVLGQDPNNTSYNDVAVNSDKEMMTNAKIDAIQFGKVIELMEINNKLLEKVVKQLNIISDYDGE